MNRKNICISALGLAAVALIVVLGSRAIAQEAKDQPQIKLPPGWTESDMQACAAAATPGKQHEFLAKGAGVWQGKAKAWMAPQTEAFVTDMTNTATPMMDGRFLKIETAGDMPGMGPFKGFGLYGF